MNVAEARPAGPNGSDISRGGEKKTSRNRDWGHKKYRPQPSTQVAMDEHG